MKTDGAPRLPTEGEYVRTYGKLVAIEDVTPKEVILDYIFEESEARVDAFINGKLVRSYGVFNNFYGENTCVEHAVTHAKELLERYGESNLEFIVIKFTRQVRMRPESSERANFYEKEFRAMRTLECGSRWNLPDEKEEVVWRSSEDREWKCPTCKRTTESTYGGCDDCVQSRMGQRND